MGKTTKNLETAPNPSGKGRRTVYTQTVDDKICDIIATTNMGLKKICESCDDIPPHMTVTKWLLDENHPFSKSYARAKAQQSEVLGDEIISLADECIPNSKFAVEKARLQVDSRKFVAAKLKPKKWGDKIYQEHVGADGGAIKLEKDNIDLSALSIEELATFKILTEKATKKNVE